MAREKAIVLGMCGLAGIMTPTPRRGSVRLTEDLSQAMVHRGPDAGRLWTDRRGLCDIGDPDHEASIVLGHRRLSIVDLDAGQQPMANERGDVWVTFNGEIYNQPLLRRDLEDCGHRFVTRCDTEVLVHGWEQWGTEMFGKLNGIFTIALFDRRQDELVLARDPAGVKPLYVGTASGMTWWSSELGPALATGLPAGEISPDALRLYFSFRFVPAPWTILENVSKLPPGHFVRIPHGEAGGKLRLQRYRCELRSAAAPRGRLEWEEALESELERAVSRQLMADVPVASLLSGGVDSTLVTQLMVDNLDTPPHSYGIGFLSAGRSSEAIAAAAAAQALGTTHHTVEVADDEYLRQWPEMFSYIGEPVANASGLLIQLLCQRVGEEHKVVLSGQGADEPLGGYPRHIVERLYPLARHVPLGTALPSRVLGMDNALRLQRVLGAQDRVDRYAETFSVLPFSDVDALVPSGITPTRDLARAAVQYWTDGQEPADTVNELLRIDARMSLADDLLLIADHFSMRASVELRVPFLDLEFLDLVERMPSRYKISRLGSRKWLYRRSAARRLPSSERRRLSGSNHALGRKHGFDAPVTSWFDPRGPVDRSGAWLESLMQLPLLSALAIKNVAVAPDDSQNARKRVSLYALSRWLVGGPVEGDWQRSYPRPEVTHRSLESQAPRR